MDRKHTTGRSETTIKQATSRTQQQAVLLEKMGKMRVMCRGTVSGQQYPG
jgi:hypothetical protein